MTFDSAYAIFYGCAMTASTFSWLLGRITWVRHSGLMAVLNALSTVLYVVWGWTWVASIGAASTALYAWSWWHGGGGGGTRRRLKSWARRFQGVRRTAPSHA